MQDNSESSLHQINQRRQKIDQQNGSSNSRRCRWCGRSRLCRRSECPARDRYCNKCHIIGHFEKVCRQDSTRRINKRQPVHKLEDDDEEDEEEEDEVTSVYSFNSLYNLKAMESEHIRPLWISTTATSQVHKVNVEVDTGADCNVMPVYLFSKIFRSKQPESSDARIQAYGGRPVTIVGKLVSGQGSQFTSEQYTSFAKEYNIKITHSSPKYPQSNGFIESMVKITKQILERCKQTNSDPHIAMLLYRATPLQSGMASPAELLSQRRYQTTLPVKNREPIRSRNHRETMAKSTDKREEYFNKKATDYCQLQMHEPIYVQLNPDKATWQKANVIGTPTENKPRSYKIQLPTGQRFTRNRRHLRPDRGTTPDDNEPDQIVAREPRGPRRSARESHPPIRLRYNQLGEPSSY